jgi:hypothetical protein
MRSPIVLSLALASACAQNSGPPREGTGSDAGRARDDAGSVVPGDECDNGYDDDSDGAIDEGCPCALGTTQACHPDRATAGVGACRRGIQRCESMGAAFGFGACAGAITSAAETCANGWDEDCDSRVDEGCPPMTVEVAVDLAGDCVSVSCPPAAPYPVGCSITMEGEDTRGCVAARADAPAVYFQEGDACGEGRVFGRLACSNVMGSGLSQTNCMINKTERFYPSDRSGCPVITE